MKTVGVIGGHGIFEDNVNYIRMRDGLDMSNEYPVVKPLKRGYYDSVRTEPKIGRNTECSCGSGKKYKRCCMQQN